MIRVPYFVLVFLLIIPKINHAQERLKISGWIVDAENQNAIEGVHVRLPDANLGVITNREGYFELELKHFPARLVISHVGYEELELKYKKPGEKQILLKKTPLTCTF